MKVIALTFPFTPFSLFCVHHPLSHDQQSYLRNVWAGSIVLERYCYTKVNVQSVTTDGKAHLSSHHYEEYNSKQILNPQPIIVTRKKNWYNKRPLLLRENSHKYTWCSLSKGCQDLTIHSSLYFSRGYGSYSSSEGSNAFRTTCIIFLHHFTSYP